MTLALGLHSHYSRMLSTATPSDLVRHAKALGYTAAALTDNNSVSGAVEFVTACKKEGIRPILGIDIEGDLYLAQNKAGWQEILSTINDGTLEDEELTLDGSDLGISPNIISVDKSAYDDCRLIDKEYLNDLQVIVCSKLGITLRDINGGTFPSFYQSIFDGSKDFYLRPPSEVLHRLTLFEQIEDTVEDFEILQDPMLPNYEWTDSLSQEDFFVKLCRDGWVSRFGSGFKDQVYVDRIKEELRVIAKAGLHGYFLIVWDYVKWAREQGFLLGPGRGSASGSLASYLLEITDVDPVKYGLIFSRFYNEGRITPGKIALPDIDVDFPKHARDVLVNYLRGKYGVDRVAHMATFGTLQGRAALKEVLRINNSCSFSEMNAITRYMIADGKLAGELKEAKTEAEEKQKSGKPLTALDHMLLKKSSIALMLHKYPEVFGDYGQMDKEGNIFGPYSRELQQAIRLEGTIKSRGTHASGVVISSDPLYTICPMSEDKNSNHKIPLMDMHALESLGLVKFDILSLASLDRLMGVNSLLQFGMIKEIT